MLTVEEQIQRIADHALERATPPAPTSRLRPAMVAAAVVLLAAGSVMWMVGDRRSGGVSIVPSEVPSLSARLAGADQYPLTATEPDDKTSTGLVIEKPGSLAAVTTEDGVTVFRASGLNAAPGSKVYQGRCAGVPGQSVGCDVPGYADLPWLVGTPFLPDGERLSIWVDVPADTAAVLITDGDVIRWQAPVAGLAVWPAPASPGWKAEALDASGATIISVDESTNEQLQAAAAAAFDPADTANGDMTVIQQARDCLIANGAKFGADNVRPIVALGVSGEDIWTLCIASLFDEYATVDSTIPANDNESLMLPTVLPDGWRVFAVSRTSSIVRPSSDQVFGRYEQDRLVGLRVRVSPDAFFGVAGAEDIEVRGQSAAIFWDDVGWHVQWEEQGVLVDVTARLLEREPLLAAVEQLEFRSDPITGFEPQSATSELPLLSEATTNETTPQVMTGLRLTEGDSLPSQTDGAGAGAFDRTITIFISDRSGLFGSAPEIVFGGERRGDHVIAGDPAGGNGLAAVLADGTIVAIRLPDGVDSEVAEAILEGLAPQPMIAFLALQDEASALLAQLPEVIASTIDDQHTLRLRGGTADAPEAMCLEVDGIERCKLALVASPIGEPSWVNGVVIEGRWFLFGYEPAEQGRLTIARWPAGETLEPLPPTGSVADGVHYWFTEIPTDVDDVRIQNLPSAEGQETTFRRPDR